MLLARLSPRRTEERIIEKFVSQVCEGRNKTVVEFAKKKREGVIRGRRVRLAGTAESAGRTGDEKLSAPYLRADMTSGGWRGQRGATDKSGDVCGSRKVRTKDPLEEFYRVYT